MEFIGAASVKHGFSAIGLDKYPNVVTEMGAVLAELGRQPIRAR